MRIMLSLSEEMHDALENERNQLMFRYVQDEDVNLKAPLLS